MSISALFFFCFTFTFKVFCFTFKVLEVYAPAPAPLLFCFTFKILEVGLYFLDDTIFPFLDANDIVPAVLLVLLTAVPVLLLLAPAASLSPAAIVILPSISPITYFFFTHILVYCKSENFISPLTILC